MSVELVSREVFTSSIVVQALPEHFSQVCYDLGNLADTHFAYLERKTGKVIVLLETYSIQAIHEWIENARDIEGVLSVAMVYQHVEPESSLNEVIA